MKAVRVNVLPLVTPWLLARVFEARNRELVLSVKAQCVAVPVAVTDPSVMAETGTCLPFGLPASGAPTVGPDLFPRAYVLVASAKVAGC